MLLFAKFPSIGRIYRRAPLVLAPTPDWPAYKYINFADNLVFLSFQLDLGPVRCIRCGTYFIGGCILIQSSEYTYNAVDGVACWVGQMILTIFSGRPE